MSRSLLLAGAMAAILASASAGADARCRSLRRPGEIPRGYHPVTVRWYGDDRPDLVCIAKDGAWQMQVSHWMGFQPPSGYRIVMTDRSLDTAFRGCAQCSTWQGVDTCMASWPNSQVVRR